MKHKELSLVTRPKMKVVYNRIQQGFYDYEDVVDDLGIFFTEPPTDQYKCIIEMNIEVRLPSPTPYIVTLNHYCF